MPRFAILHHITPVDAEKPDHYDLLLEDGDVLKTFTLESFPSVDTSATAVADFDHRMIYLDYEGPISNNRGEVTQADSGTFSWITRQADQITVQLQGKRLVGQFTLKIQDSSADS